MHLYELRRVFFIYKWMLDMFKIHDKDNQKLEKCARYAIWFTSMLYMCLREGTFSERGCLGTQCTALRMPPFSRCTSMYCSDTDYQIYIRHVYNACLTQTEAMEVIPTWNIIDNNVMHVLGRGHFQHRGCLRINHLVCPRSQDVPVWIMYLSFNYNMNVLHV